jgi:hypothetical protein
LELCEIFAASEGIAKTIAVETLDPAAARFPAFPFYEFTSPC